MCANRYLLLTMRQNGRQTSKPVDLELHGEQLVANHAYSIPQVGAGPVGQVTGQASGPAAPEEAQRDGTQNSMVSRSVPSASYRKSVTRSTVGKNTSVQTEVTLQDLKSWSPSRAVSTPAPTPPKVNQKQMALETENERLKERIVNLEKQVDRLNNELSRVTKENTNMLNEKKQLGRSLERALEDAEKYRQQYEHEKAAHLATKEDDGKTIALLRNEMASLKRAHSEELAQLDSRYAAEVEALRKDMQTAIADRDQRLERLKLQISDSMKSNSHERQLQIEDLVKQVASLQSENDSLRTQLKRSKHNGDDSQVRNLQQQLADKERMLFRLADLCSKFESQFKQHSEFTEILRRVHESASADSEAHGKVTMQKVTRR